MDTFPDLLQLVGSSVNEDDGFQISRAVSGRPKIRSYFTQMVRKFNIRFELDDTDKVTLEDFYLAHKMVAFYFLWKADQITYIVQFTESPQYQYLQGGYWVISVDMEEM